MPKSPCLVASVSKAALSPTRGIGLWKNGPVVSDFRDAERGILSKLVEQARVDLGRIKNDFSKKASSQAASRRQ